MRRFVERVALAASAGAVGFALSASPLAQTTKSTNDGVYTEAQAARGQKGFEGACTVCHDVDRFRGNDFTNSWRNEPLSSVFETISGTMPADNPGGLKPQEYADIIAYFLKLNRYPAGADELAGSKDAMAAIKFDAVK